MSAPVHASVCIRNLYIQADAADLEKRLMTAHEAIAKHLLDLGETEGHLEQSRNTAASLETR